MAVRPTDSLPSPPAPPAGEGHLPRGRRQPWPGNILTCCAVLASGLWAPVILLVARAVRPAQLDDVTRRYPRAVLEALAADARQRMWAIVLASFLALLALAVAAIVLNRRAANVARGEPGRRPIRPSWWASAGLLLALVLVLASVLRSPSAASLAGASLGVLAMAGAMAGLILGATALRRAAAQPPDSALPRRDFRQLAARISLIVAPLFLLAGVVFTGLLAQLTASFLLFLVY